MLYDQIEIEPSYVYSGSSINDIFLNSTNISYEFYGNLISSNTINGQRNYEALFNSLLGTIANGLSGTRGGYTYGSDMVIGNFNPTTTNTTNFDNTYFSSSNILTYGQAYNFISKNYSSSTKRFLKLYSTDETLTDTIMPDPEIIYLSGTLDQQRHAPIFLKQTGGESYIKSSFMMVCYNIVTSSFVYYDYVSSDLFGDAGDSLYPGGGSTTNFNVSPLDDQIYLGNYKWAFQFPFQREYKNVKRDVITLNTPRYLTSSLMYFDGTPAHPGTGISAFAAGVTIEIDRGHSFSNAPPDLASIEQHLKIQYPPIELKKSITNPVSMIYAGKSNQLKADSSTYLLGASNKVTKSFYSLIDINMNDQTDIDFTLENQMLPIGKNTLLFHFYSFGDFLGKFADGLTSTIASTGSGAVTKFWNHPGFSNIVITPDTTSSNETYKYELVTGSLLGHKCRGYKFGVYKPIPDYSYAIFRNNKFGQVRDMLEQRLYTNFYNSTTKFGSIVGIKFSSTSSYGITSSNYQLNPRDSGIYDFEYKCGQPFFDDDERMI